MSVRLNPVAWRRPALMLTVVFGVLLTEIGVTLIMLGVFGESDPLPYEASVLLGVLALLIVAAMVRDTVRLYRWRPLADSFPGSEQSATVAPPKTP